MTVNEAELDRLEGLYADGCHGDGWRVECCHENTDGRYSRGGCCSAPSIVTTTDQGKQIVALQVIPDDAEFAAAVHNAFPALLAAARALSAEKAAREEALRAILAAEAALTTAEAETARLRERVKALEGTSRGALEILAERRRQVEAEGWAPEHDDTHRHGEIARAAVCYADPLNEERERPPAKWPWDASWWKPRDRRRDLVRAGALIAAEIDRLDRAAAIRSLENSNDE